MPADPDTSEYAPENFMALFMGSGPVGALLGYSPSSFSGECPSSSWEMLGYSFTIDAGCALWDQISGILSDSMLAVWSITALFIVLSA